jgi:hypothetical protein
MKRFVVAIVGTLLLVCGQPHPAHANIWRWIDELSGPGPFTGYEIEWRVVCFGEPAAPLTAEQLAAIGRQEAPPGPDEPEKKNPKAKAAAVAVGFLAPGCVIDRVPVGGRRRASINVSFGWFASYNNHLRYDPPARDAGDSALEVKLTSLESSFDYRLFPGLDAGAGVAVYFFSGAKFDSFSRLTIEPLRFSLRPIAMAKSDSACLSSDEPCWQRTLVVRASYFLIPKGFAAEDFGAVPGTYRTSRDKLFSVAIMADTEPLYRWLKKRL